MLNHAVDWCVNNNVHYAIDLGPSGTFVNALKDKYDSDCLAQLSHAFTKGGKHELEAALNIHRLIKSYAD